MLHRPQHEAAAGLNVVTTLRAQLDAVDARIVAALGERMALSLGVARVKAELGLPQRDSRREAFILRRARKLARPPLEGRAAEKVLATVLAVTRAAAKAALRNRGKHGS
ncbi:MAG: chorismate mutase [Planctomycetes bacterium]|nr:chorismate mutase [Planctomycetota bacterium]